MSAIDSISIDKNRVVHWYYDLAVIYHNLVKFENLIFKDVNFNVISFHNYN